MRSEFSAPGKEASTGGELVSLNPNGQSHRGKRIIKLSEAVPDQLFLGVVLRGEGEGLREMQIKGVVSNALA